MTGMIHVINCKNMRLGVFLVISGIMVLIFGVCIAPLLAVWRIIGEIGTGVPASVGINFNVVLEQVGIALAVSLPLGGILIHIGRNYLNRKD